MPRLGMEDIVRGRIAILRPENPLMDYRAVLTFDLVNERLRYEPTTGDFFWKVHVARNIRAGTLAGAEKATRTGKDGKPVRYRYIRMEGWSIPAQQFAWLLSHGEWPPASLRFADGNSLNIRLDNLVLAQALASKYDWKNPETRAQYLSEHQDSYPLAYRDKQLQRDFGLTLAEYGQMLVAQNGVCAICLRPETLTRGGKLCSLAVDHDHETNATRGLLCHHCNTGLGKFGDDPAMFERAATYLRKYKSADVIPFTQEGA